MTTHVIRPTGSIVCNACLNVTPIGLHIVPPVDDIEWFCPPCWEKASAAVQITTGDREPVTGIQPVTLTYSPGGPEARCSRCNYGRLKVRYNGVAICAGCMMKAIDNGEFIFGKPVGEAVTTSATPDISGFDVSWS